MRLENVHCLRGLIAAGALSLTACSGSSAPEVPVQPISEQKDISLTRVASDGTGNCNFDATPDDLLVLALNPTEYGQVGMCGGCVELQGPNAKKVTVRVVDSCGGCTDTQFGVTPEVFKAVGAEDLLTATVQWRYSTCPVHGPVRYHFNDGSSQYWTALQVRNHRWPIERLEWNKNGTWTQLPRQPYNYFVEPSGMVPPVQVRITATNGETLTDTPLPTVAGSSTVDGAAQFSE